MRLRIIQRSPVRRVRPHRAIQAVGAALAALALTACGGSAPRSDGNVPFLEPPTEGTIILYQVATQKMGRKIQPEMIRITTVAEKPAVQRNNPTRIAGGEIDEDVPGSRATDKQIAREILKNSFGKPFVVSPDRFARLCTDLEEAGLFLLPKFRGGIPPKDKPYVSFSTGAQTWIYLRPTDAPERDLPKDPVQRQKSLSAWGQSKMLILLCTQGG